MGERADGTGRQTGVDKRPENGDPEDLVQTLLDRSGRTVRPTEVGAAVLPYARAALNAVDGIRLAIEEMSGLVRGHLSVGMVSSVSAIDLPAVLAQFAHRHPGVEITLREADSAQLLDALTARLLDAALVGLSGPLPTGIEAAVVGEVPLVAIVAPTDPLSTSKAIKLAITEPSLVGRQALAWRAEGPISPAARAFVSHARTTITDRRRAPVS